MLRRSIAGSLDDVRRSGDFPVELRPLLFRLTSVDPMSSESGEVNATPSFRDGASKNSLDSLGTTGTD